MTAYDICTCGNCGLSWNDSTPTAYTPAPAARCPFEYFHKYEDGGQPVELEPEDIPRDFEVQPVTL